MHACYAYKSGKVFPCFVMSEVMVKSFWLYCFYQTGFIMIKYGTKLETKNFNHQPITSFFTTNMRESNKEIRHIFKFCYEKGKNATQAAKNRTFIDAVSVRVAQSWFKHLRGGNSFVKDAARSGLLWLKSMPFLKK